MSGICGLFNLNNAPVAPDELRSMTAMLERRGPQGSRHWNSGLTGLGHTLLATTPELVFERQPFFHAASNCVITADVRLDNRDELLAAFQIEERRATTGDAELILRAYLTWGDSCPNRLLGDFAFAIWDPRDKRMFCARDHFGMRPFYYHHKEGCSFLFASETRAILVLPRVPYQISAGRVADFLVEELQWIDYTSTFFDGINRLPPGHMLTVTPASAIVAEYWRPAPLPDPGFANDEDYRQGFLDVFTQSVEARLRTPSASAASMLSGGMDSGSVVATAADILGARNARPMATFSAVTDVDSERYRESDLRESRAINAAILMPGISPTLVYPEQLGADFETLISGNEEPFDSEFMFMKAIYLAALRQGEHVVLDGGGGDIVLSEGTYITRLLRSGDIRLALAEIAAEPRYRCYGSFFTALIPYLRSAVTPDALRRWMRGPRTRHHVKQVVRGSLISEDFAASVGIQTRFERMHETFNVGWKNDYASERSNMVRYAVTAGRERYARLAAGMSVEARDPFLDKRVVDYCSLLPGRFRLQNGWPKMILRDLMVDKLPAEVLWCRGKPHVGWIFNAAVARQAYKTGHLDIDGLRTNLGPYVDPDALSSTWTAFANGGDAEHIYHAYVLSLWLQESAERPALP